MVRLFFLYLILCNKISKLLKILEKKKKPNNENMGFLRAVVVRAFICTESNGRMLDIMISKHANTSIKIKYLKSLQMVNWSF